MIAPQQKTGLMPDWFYRELGLAAAKLMIDATAERSCLALRLGVDETDVAEAMRRLCVNGGSETTKEAR